MAKGRRDLAPLTGALFVVLVVVGFVALGGDTPDGDASASKVVSFYKDDETKQIIAAVLVAFSVIPLLAFAATLRERFLAVVTGRSALPAFVMGAGAVTAAGFVAAAGIHFALADYAGDIAPSASQALNALDADFFLAFTTGVAALVLGASLLTLRTRLLPVWLGWVGIVVFVAFFTPVGFFAFMLSGIWIIVVSILLYLRDEAAPAAAGAMPAVA